MAREVDPKDTTRAAAYALWMKATNPMVTFFKTLDVTNLIRVSKKRKLKFNMLLDYCIGKAACGIREFYLLPVGGRLLQYDSIAVNTIVKNKDGGVSSCDILFTDDLAAFNQAYLTHTAEVAHTAVDRDLSGTLHGHRHLRHRGHGDRRGSRHEQRYLQQPLYVLGTIPQNIPAV